MLGRGDGAFPHGGRLLNIGNVMDMAWTENYGDKISALLIVWQGGMESGNAAADVLTGRVNPCGRLSGYHRPPLCRLPQRRELWRQGV